MSGIAAHGSPVSPFSDALLATLKADATLVALAPGGIYTALKQSTTTTFPYVVLTRAGTNAGGAGAMGLEGGRVWMNLDVWSEKNSPYETEQILSRIRYLLQRETLTVAGFSMIAHSLACDEEHVLPDFDPDMPTRSLFHGIQFWTCLIEETSP
jgi:hypothetical protein